MARCRPYGRFKSDHRKPGRNPLESALPTAQHTPDASSPPDLDAALPLPDIKRLVMSTFKQGTVKGERLFRRSVAVVRGLARKACGSAGYSWTKAARDGASQVAMRGLEGLLSASEPYLREGFNQVVAETAEAYLEGLKHQSNVRGRLQGRKRRTSRVKRGARGSHNKQPKARLGTHRDHPDSHSLRCQACGASAEWGLRGSKEGGSVRFVCRAHATSTGCFRVDPDRAVWAADQELRRLRAKARRLEQELRDLGGTAEDAPSAPPFAAGQESGSTTDCVSMPKSRSLIATLLLRGGVESNPGPTSQEEKELALKRSWQEIDSDIDSDLLDHLAKQQLTVERWRRATSKGSGSQTLTDLKANYPGSWLAGWTGILEDAAATSTGQPGPSTAGTRVRGPQALSDFWLALHRAEISHSRKVLSLVDGTSFLGDPWLGKKLYLRDCYEGLEQELKQIFDQKDGSGERAYSAVAIIGNPGIGKSLFGYLLLYRWAHEGRRVVVVKQNVCPKPTLLTADGAFELDHVALRDELSDPEVRYLVDSLNPGGVGPLPTKAQMVLVTSPDIKVYQEVWKRNGYDRRYMDTWSWEELAKCHQSIFSQLPIGEVQARYDRWGGIPRYIFEKLGKADQALLDAEIGKTNLTKLVAAAGAPESHHSASHKLLHMRVDDNFIDTWMEMASPYVSEKVAYGLWEKEKEALQLFLSVSAGEKGPEAFRGNLWEGFCHRKLAQGGAFRIRDLSAPSSRLQEVKLGRSTTHIFDDWKEVESLPDGQYFRPRSKSMGSVDSGMQPNILFQITVSDDHDLKCLPLQKAFDSMKSKKQSGTVNVFFVNPPDTFPRMKAAKIGQGPGVGSLRVAVKQYALEVPF